MGTTQHQTLQSGPRVKLENGREYMGTAQHIAGSDASA